MAMREGLGDQARWVCHSDSCPLNVAAQKALDVQMNVRALVYGLVLVGKWAAILGALYLFVRWAAS